MIEFCLLSDRRWEVHTHSSYYAFISSLSGPRLPFNTSFDRAFLQASPARGSGHSTPRIRRSFFFAESDPSVLLSCQIFLHAQQIALAGTLNNPQQLSYRSDLLQLLLNEPLKKIVGRIIGLSLCHGHKRIDLGCDLLFLFERKLYRVFGDFEVRLWRGHSGNLHSGTGVNDEPDKTQRVLLVVLGLLVKMRR